MSEPIEVLLFDVFGTVVDWRGSIARHAAEAFGGAASDWLAFADAWRARYQPAMEEVRSGQRGFVRLDVLHRENLDAILADFGLAHLDETARVRTNLFWHALDGWPDSASGLGELKRHGLVCAHSNGNIRLIADMARHAGLNWDAICGAEVVGAYKPMPRAYRNACAVMGIEPRQAMMVAAHNDDLAAARACGLKTAFVLRPREHGDGQSSDLAPAQDWDYVACDFHDLARQLAAA
ncbi:MAG: haloacid dehalogenase type II [Rhodobiaceae bacterium]|nr:haloacid dehalogenase type II [Rhodobiaceae bacterium]MCC0042461.1 haloacid dehalogenase type II [Rhodobiaceae bacterium]